LQPIGIDCLRADTADEATALIEIQRVHIAVIDLRIPLDRSADGPSGERVLKLLRRMDSPPPTVVVRPRPATLRGATRGLSSALREGAYTVMDGPIKIEPMLEVLRRIFAGTIRTIGPRHERFLSVRSHQIGADAPQFHSGVSRHMKVRPLGDKIIVKRQAAESQTESGIFLPESAKDKPKQGKIVAVGDGNLNKDTGARVPFTVKKGDEVIFSSYSGTEIKIDGEDVLIMTEDDILGIID
jgi:chaperonin GroES